MAAADRKAPQARTGNSHPQNQLGPIALAIGLTRDLPWPLNPLPAPNLLSRPSSMRLPEAARLLGISLAYIYVLKDAGKIRVRRIGRAARIHRDDLEAFAAGLPMAPLKYGSEPTGPLLGVDQQRLAVGGERCAETQAPQNESKNESESATAGRKAPPRRPCPIDQQQPALARVEPPPADETACASRSAA